MPVQTSSSNYSLPWLLQQIQSGRQPPPAAITQGGVPKWAQMMGGGGPNLLPGMQAFAGAPPPGGQMQPVPQQGGMTAPLIGQRSGGLAAGMGFDQMRQLMPGPWGQPAMPQIPRYQPGAQMQQLPLGGLQMPTPPQQTGLYPPNPQMPKWAQMMGGGGPQKGAPGTYQDPSQGLLRPGAPPPQQPPPPGLSRPLGDPGAPRPTMMGQLPGGAPVWQQRGRIASAFGQPSDSQINRAIPRKQATSYASGMQGERMGRKKMNRQTRLARRAGGAV